MSIVGELRKTIFPILESVLRYILSSPYIGSFFNLFLSFCSSFSRLFIGAWSASGLKQCKRPAQPLILYQYEACPFCRRVREALSVLKINVIIYPCPRTTLAQYGVERGSRYRSEATVIAGKCIFPILVDPNSRGDDSADSRVRGKVVVDSKEIVAYLWNTYGDQAKMPWNYALLGGMNSPPLLLALPSLFRLLPDNGMMKDNSVISKVPKQLLELYSFDGCPYSRLIRERLDCIEMPYLCINDNPAVALRGSVRGKRPGMCDNDNDPTLSGATLTSHLGSGSGMGTDTDATAGTGTVLPSRMTEEVVIATPTLLDRNDNSEIISDYRTMLMYINAMYLEKTEGSGSSSGESSSVWATYSTVGATSDNYILGTATDRKEDTTTGMSVNRKVD